MKVTFINRSDNPVFLILSNQTDLIAPNYGKSIEVHSDRFTFSSYFDLPSNIKNLLFFKSMVLKYNSSLLSEYEVSGFDQSENVVIELFQKVGNGDQLDYYSYVYPTSQQALITNIKNRVYDEPIFIEKVRQSKKREKIGIIIMSLINALDTFIYIAVPLLVLFFGVKSLVDTRTAIIVTAFFAGIGFVVGFVLRLLINFGLTKFNKKHNISDEPKPKKKYKGYRFYFDNDYISGVIFDSNENEHQFQEGITENGNRFVTD